MAEMWLVNTGNHCIWRLMKINQWRRNTADWQWREEEAVSISPHGLLM